MGKGEERKKTPISDDANLAAPWMWVRVEEGKGLVEGNGRKAW